MEKLFFYFIFRNSIGGRDLKWFLLIYFYLYNRKNYLDFRNIPLEVFKINDGYRELEIILQKDNNY